MTGLDWMMLMFRAFFDDSGTDDESEIAVAACYVSTKRGWDTFVNEWDRARREEGFDYFHMAEFAAPRDHGHKPYCDWDDSKKDRVYNRLARIINENKRTGISIAVPKEVWNNAPDHIRFCFGREHYTFAVMLCMMQVAKWKRGSQIRLPIHYVFDWEMRDSRKRKEIEKVFDTFLEPSSQGLAEIYGVEPDGFAFEHKEMFKPLQAADVLAWQMRSHMRKIWPGAEDDLTKCHSGFRMLREDQEMDLGFMTERNIKKFIDKVNEWEAELGQAMPERFA